MEEREYVNKDGKKGKTYRLEDKDKVRILFPQAREFGNFGKYSIMITEDLKTPVENLKDTDKKYIELTKSQGEQLNKLGLSAGDLIKAEAYKHPKYPDTKTIGIRKA